MNVPRFLCRLAPALLAVVVAGCGSEQVGEGADRCFGGGIYDYSADDPGQATPGAAVRAMADQLEAIIEKERASIPATAERDARLAMDRVAVLGLRALQPVADAAAGEGTLEATAEEGDVVARAELRAAPAGGFHVSSLNAEANCSYSPT